LLQKVLSNKGDDIVGHVESVYSTSSAFVELLKSSLRPSIS